VHWLVLIRVPIILIVRIPKAAKAEMHIWVLDMGIAKKAILIYQYKEHSKILLGL